MNWDYRDKGEVFGLLDEAKKWNKEGEGLYIEKHRWAMIGTQERIDKEQEDLQYNFDRNLTFSLEFSRDIGTRDENVGGSLFRVELLVRVLGYILDNSKGRLTLKNDSSKMMKKHCGKNILLNVDCRNSKFYPMKINFNRINLSALIAPKRREKKEKEE